MNIDTATNKFEKDICNLVNNSGLPACVIRLILSSVLEKIHKVETSNLESYPEDVPIIEEAVPPIVEPVK